MRVKFWGTRGSIATPGKDTVKYGGNTSCVEFQSASGTRIIIDCGTGARALGQMLMAKRKDHMRGNILITHTHWDHIQGIPFFAPLFVPGSEWDIYGPKGLSQSIKDTLTEQMQYTYFPVSLDQTGATIRYHDVLEDDFQIGDVKITTRYLNHTMLTCGYRLEADGVSAIYACDHEPHSRALALGKGDIKGPDQQYAEFLADADLVIHDAQYTAEEYPAKAGWGHSTIEYDIKICLYAHVKKLALTHHDPLRKDKELDSIIKTVTKKLAKDKQTSLKVFAAAEGQEIILTPSKNKIKKFLPEKKSEHVLAASSLMGHSALLSIIDSKIIALLTKVMSSDNIQVKFASDVAEIEKKIVEENPSIILIEHNPSLMDGLKISHDIRKNKNSPNEKQLPIILIAEKEETANGKKAGVTDWLITPFSLSYARSKIQAWILRTALRWARPSIPKDEDQRLSALYKLNILDTRPEERFDRITRIASALFKVPIVLITLIDKDRQWFKSRVGTEIQESPRDMSMCAHVVYDRAPMVIPDTLKDDRFADNPIVTSGPHVRFYAGCPLILDNGACIGTLCLIDRHPRFLEKAEIKSLEDLRDIIVDELQS